MKVELKDLIGVAAFLLSVYNVVVAQAKDRREKKKQEDRRENPIRLALGREYEYEGVVVQARSRADVATFLSLRVRNVSGETISIGRPYALSSDESEVNFPTPESFPLLMEAAEVLVCKVPLDEVLEMFPEMKDVTFTPYCEVIGLAEFEGSERTYPNHLHRAGQKGKRQAKKASPKARRIS